MRLYYKALHSYVVTKCRFWMLCVLRNPSGDSTGADGRRRRGREGSLTQSPSGHEARWHGATRETGKPSLHHRAGWSPCVYIILHDPFTLLPMKIQGQNPEKKPLILSSWLKWASRALIGKHTCLSHNLDSHFLKNSGVAQIHGYCVIYKWSLWGFILGKPLKLKAL